MQYEGIIPEHLAVRSHAGVFDVSHMGQLELRGAGTMRFAQAALSNDLDRIGPGHAQYTLLLEDTGCPVDDLIVYRFADDHLLPGRQRQPHRRRPRLAGRGHAVRRDDGRPVGRAGDARALQGLGRATLVELAGRATAVRLYAR